MENRTQTCQFAALTEGGVVKQIGHFYVGVPSVGKKEDEIHAENNYNSGLLHNSGGVHTGDSRLPEDEV